MNSIGSEHKTIGDIASEQGALAGQIIDGLELALRRIVDARGAEDRVHELAIGALLDLELRRPTLQNLEVALLDSAAAGDWVGGDEIQVSGFDAEQVERLRELLPPGCVVRGGPKGMIIFPPLDGDGA